MAIQFKPIFHQSHRTGRRYDFSRFPDQHNAVFQLLSEAFVYIL